MEATNAKCLCKNSDGTPCTYIGSMKSITYHLRHKHNSNQKKGVSFENTNEPMNYQVSKSNIRVKRVYHKEAKLELAHNVSDGVTIDIPCILRINTLTNEKVIVLGGSE